MMENEMEVKHQETKKMKQKIKNSIKDSTTNASLYHATTSN